VGTSVCGGGSVGVRRSECAGGGTAARVNEGVKLVGDVRGLWSRISGASVAAGSGGVRAGSTSSKVARAIEIGIYAGIELVGRIRRVWADCGGAVVVAATDSCVTGGIKVGVDTGVELVGHVALVRTSGGAVGVGTDEGISNFVGDSGHGENMWVCSCCED